MGSHQSAFAVDAWPPPPPAPPPDCVPASSSSFSPVRFSTDACMECRACDNSFFLDACQRGAQRHFIISFALFGRASVAGGIVPTLFSSASRGEGSSLKAVSQPASYVPHTQGEVDPW